MGGFTGYIKNVLVMMKFACRKARIKDKGQRTKEKVKSKKI
jgi:hypothetical protein